MDATKWYASKTLWAMVVATAASFAAPHLGVNIDASEQVTIVAVIGIVLRVITKQPISFS